MAVQTAPRPALLPGIPTETVRGGRLWSRERIGVLIAFALFLTYGTFRAFENAHIETLRAPASLFAGGFIPNYISPFYSPPLHHIPGWPAALSPALLLLALPGTFRFTCYFCRRTYYRAVFGNPPSCAAREVLRRSTKYSGEQEFPLYMQNLHRYALYAVTLFVVFHWIHFFQGFLFTNAATGAMRPGAGVGTLLIALDTVLLTLYVGSCHSFRHIIGGLLNRFSDAPWRYALWARVTRLNERHGLYFWLSFASVALADFYVRSVCAGWIPDFHFVF